MLLGNKAQWTSIFVLAGLLSLFWATVAKADEQHLAFIRALQQRGYGELAAVYIEQLRGNNNVPPAVRELLDLEMCNSLRIAALETNSPDLIRQRQAAAAEYLDRFSRQHPHHPRIAGAAMLLALPYFERGQRFLSASKTVASSTTRDQLLEKSRSAFAEAKPHLDRSIELYWACATELAKQSIAAGKDTPPDARITQLQSEAESGRVETQYKLAGLEYSLAQTYSDSNDAARRKALERAGQHFDDVYQRHPNTEIGRRALLWRVRALSELGDIEMALEVLDEMQVAEPEGPKSSLEHAELFGEAELLRLQLMSKQQDPNATLSEARKWKAAHPNWRRTVAWQGIELEIAKTQLVKAKTLTPKSEAQLQQQAFKAIAEVAQENGPYKSAALELQQLHQPANIAGTKPQSKDELAMAESAIAAERWEEAIEQLQQVFTHLPKNADKEHRSKLEERFCFAQYRLALQHHLAGRQEDAINAASVIVKKHLSDSIAPAASTLAAYAALAQFEKAAAEDRSSALARLDKIANFTYQHWPSRPESDEVRIVVAQALSLNKNTQAAVALCDQIESSSSHYGTAQHLAGRIYWKLYCDHGPETKNLHTPESRAEYRNRAFEHLSASHRWHTQRMLVVGSLPRALRETLLILAQIAFDTNRHQNAIELLTPLVDQKLFAEQAESDNLAPRAYLLLVRAQLMADDLAAAEASALRLADQELDSLVVNITLVEALKLVRIKQQELKRQLSPQPKKEGNAGPGRFDEEKWGIVAEGIASRKQHSVSNLVFLADVCSEAKHVAATENLLGRISEVIGKDESLQKQWGIPLARVRIRWIGMLRQKGRYEQALAEVNDLLQTHPTVLELMVEKAKTLQGWGTTDPKHYDTATAEWTRVRKILGRSAPQSPEYYDTVYNVANCLWKDYQARKDKLKLQQARQVLKSTLALSSTLSGPEMVAKFQMLLASMPK